MDHYQKVAGGVADIAEPQEKGSAQKFGILWWFILLLIALILDAASILDTLAFEVPIADILATFFSAILFIVMLYKGASEIRMFVTWILAYLAEWIPFVDYLPLYMIGIFIVLLIDRSSIATAVVSTIPIPSKDMATRKIAGSASRRTAQRVGERASRLSRNKVFGAASHQYEARAQSLMQRLPGPMRSLPESGPKSLAPGGKRSWKRTAKAAWQASGSTRPPREARKEEESPFPGTYEDFERELLPDLQDVINIDVTGADRLAGVPRPPAG